MMAIRHEAWTRLWHYLLGAAGVGALLGLLAYAATLWFNAVFERDEHDPADVAQRVGLYTGGLAIAGAFLLAASRGP